MPGGPRGYQVLASAAVEGPRTQLALAQQLGLDRTVMTYLLDDLQKAGLVERRPDPADRRARRVVLTDAGRARLCDAGGPAARGRGAAARPARPRRARHPARPAAPPGHRLERDRPASCARWRRRSRTAHG